ncbi:SusC/RagA family TonB-linked outer membrane protein [Aestuariibaculum sp. TT11]|uniref:SusC/RagA family TonB-linked outer membrane protein n=2 Tax=Aestuariibaculum sediminum TaxID=2770637 RepID=A0A8J6UE64_9FLAO|nr:SusC/RagA family TonB-linked outer membrane protein [Aestuariibaculum sediminum]
MLCLLLNVLSEINVQGQTKPKGKYTVDFNQTSLKAIFSKLENISTYNFRYTDDIANDVKLYSFQFNNKSIEFILDQISLKTELKYKIDGTNVSLKSAQKKKVSGIVTDAETGEVLVGVSVYIKDSNVGALTDFDGVYSIEVPEGTKLALSYLGYAPKTIEVGSENTLNITLDSENTELDEVLVVGYGTVNKRDVTGSVGTVDMEDLAKAPVISFDQALAGRVAGVQVSSMEDGQPGSEMNIVIRGAGSLTQSTQPLYVIDGVPMEDPISSALNPDEIESITVLKDASQTAIYGARGANGVIVIETKQGLVGKPVVSYRASVGFDNVYKTMDMMSPYEFIAYEIERDPTLRSTYLSDNRDLDYYKRVPGIDWQDNLFNTGSTTIHSVAVRGGSEDTKYSISGSYTNNEAIVVNTGFERAQARLKLDQKLGKKGELGANINFTNQKAYGQIVGRTASSTNTAINGYLLYSVWGYRPVTGIDNGSYDFDLENELVDEDAYEDSGIFTINPVINAENVLRENTINTLTANGYYRYDINKNLELKITGSYFNRSGRNDQFYNSKTHRGTPIRLNNTNGINGSVSHSEQINWVNENTITWKKYVGENHYFNAVGGFAASGSKSNTYGFTAINLPNEELGVNGLSEGDLQTSTSDASGNTLASFMGRLNYRLASKYYFTLTMRADGSSKFPTVNKWGYFPSGAFAWRLNKEKFMEAVNFISNAKLRASYGATGNNRVSDFAYRSSLNFSDLNSYSFNNQTYTGVELSLGNDKLKWETVKQLDLGLDLGLFKDRISLETDVYLKTTDDMLLRTQIPGSSGFTSVYTNIGSIENRGLEITLNTVNVQTPSFSWLTNFNISFNKNKILSLSDGELSRFSYINSFSNRMAEEPMYIAEVGGPAAMFYGLIWDGNYQYEDFDQVGDTYVLKSNVATNGDDRSVIQPGDIKYKDLNEDGVIDAFDKAVIGNPIPKHIGGFSNVFNYKGLSLNVLFQWSYGGDLMNANRIIFEGNPTRVRRLNQFASYANRWTPENQTNEMYRVNGEGPEVVSSRTIEDGSYIRLKTLSLGYNLPESFTSKLGVNSLNVSLSAQNLITWTKYSGMDPEVSVHNSVLTPGFDFSAYPHARRIVFGLDLAF